MHQKIMFVLTIMLSGRAMTLGFIDRVGGTLPADPPSMWLIPLVGDAIIGISALWIAYLILRKTGVWVWTAIIIWNSLAILDALSAYVIHITNPWPEFFMIKLFGSSMFFIAIAMHVVLIILANRPEVRKSLTGSF